MGCYFFLSWLLWARLPFQGPCIHCWASGPLFLSLGPNGLFYYLYSQFLVALIFGLFFPLGFHKWPSTFSSLNIWNVFAIHMWMKGRFCPFLIFSLLLIFRGFFFLSCGPLFIHIYILLPAVNRFVSSNFPVWQLFSKQSRRFINSIPFWWLTLHLFSCWH